MHRKAASYNRMHECFCEGKHSDCNMHVDASHRRIQRGRIIAVERIQWTDCELREAREGLTPRRLITSFLGRS